jgi:hypothetical protein
MAPRGGGGGGGGEPGLPLPEPMNHGPDTLSLINNVTS